MKIVINICFGGFGLSYAGVMKYAELKDIKLYAWVDDITREVYGEEAVVTNPEIGIHYATEPVKDEADYNSREDDSIYWSDRDIKRDESALIQTVEELGEKASGRYAGLKIVEIPDNVEWELEEYDGAEHIAEKHKTWS